MDRLDTEKLSSHEYFVRKTLSKEKVIRRIQNYGAEPDLENKDFDIYDQLLACEAIAEAEGEQKKKKRNENVSVSGNGNDTYKRELNPELNWYKSELISKLKQCNSTTPQKEIASLLEGIFKYWPPSKNTHWLWIAQSYSPRVLNWVMTATIKKYLRGGIRKTPPAYFIYLLKFRKQRKEFRTTNGTR